MVMAKAKGTPAAGGLEWSKYRKPLQQQVKHSLKYNDPKHKKWRIMVQCEVDKLYDSMQEMEQSRLVNKNQENAEEAILAVLCMIGDLQLVEKWLSHAGKHIRFDFQLGNFCERIEQWLVELRNENDHEYQFLDYATTSRGLAATLLERVSAERLEGCTILHCASISGDANTMAAVNILWQTALKEAIDLASAQAQRRPNDAACSRRLEELQGEWRIRTTLGDTPYDLVPVCEPAGQGGCQCSASFNDIPCTSTKGRKSLLANMETQTPALFGAFFAALAMGLFFAIVSLKLDLDAVGLNQPGAARWVGLGTSFVFLWVGMTRVSFVRNLWNVVYFALVMFDLLQAPAQRPVPTSSELASVRARRLRARVQRILEMVLGIESPGDNDLRLLEGALREADSMGHAEPGLNQDVLARARDLLRTHREAQRREKEFKVMREIASSLLATLAELEVELKTAVETPVSDDLRSRTEAALLRADDFAFDTREKDSADEAKIARRSTTVRSLLLLRQQLEDALANVSDEWFEKVVAECREARIQDSKAVRARLKAIDQPRTVLADLQAALDADNLDLGTLQRTVQAASECAESFSGGAKRVSKDLTTAIEHANELITALKSLEQAKSHGRRAHAQLLVAADQHDTSHIGRVEEEVAAFSAVCCKTRSAVLPANVAEAQELIDKWKREQGPSAALKAAVAGSDIEHLRKCIAIAREAGIGVKAAKKRLSQLEQNEKTKVELDEAMKGDDASRLREAIAVAVKGGMNVTEAKATLAVLTQREHCQEQLRKAISAKSEELLREAIETAEATGIDCTDAYQQLGAIVAKKQSDLKRRQKQEAARRAEVQAKLTALVADSDCSLKELTEVVRDAREVHLDTLAAVERLRDGFANNLERILADPKQDIQLLNDELQAASVLESFGSPLDTSEARRQLEKWKHQQRFTTELSDALTTAKKNVDERSLTVLLECYTRVEEVLGSDAEIVASAKDAIALVQATLELQGSQRKCRLAHEQSCMMHPRVDLEPGVPEYLQEFRSDLEAAKQQGVVPADTISDMERLAALWEKDAELIYELFDAIKQRDQEALSAALSKAKESGSHVNLEPPKRALNKLIKKAEKDNVTAALKAAVKKKHDCSGLAAAIEAAKTAGVPTFEATKVYVAWVNEGRNLLKKARVQRNKEKLREALETTEAMGLSHLSEWQEARRFVEGTVPNALPGKQLIQDRTQHPRYKTELCTHWLMHGCCSYGKERCNFAHGEADLRKPNFQRERTLSESSATSRDALDRPPGVNSPPRKPQGSVQSDELSSAPDVNSRPSSAISAMATAHSRSEGTTSPDSSDGGYNDFWDNGPVSDATQSLWSSSSAFGHGQLPLSSLLSDHASNDAAQPQPQSPSYLTNGGHEMERPRSLSGSGAAAFTSDWSLSGYPEPSLYSPDSAAWQSSQVVSSFSDPFGIPVSTASVSAAPSWSGADQPPTSSFSSFAGPQPSAHQPSMMNEAPQGNEYAMTTGRSHQQPQPQEHSGGFGIADLVPELALGPAGVEAMFPMPSSSGQLSSQGTVSGPSASSGDLSNHSHHHVQHQHQQHLQNFHQLTPQQQQHFQQHLAQGGISAMHIGSPEDDDLFLAGVLDRCIEEGFNDLAQSLCSYCSQREQSVVLMPCAHVGLCRVCAAVKPDKCPSCGVHVQSHKIGS